MKKLYTHIPLINKYEADPFRFLKKAILPSYYWLAAHFTATPGLFVTRQVWQMAFRLWLRGQLRGELREKIFSFPMDSVRYFEYDFMWPLLTKKTLGRYLDLSSPRLLLALVLKKTLATNAVLVNPDKYDLQMTYNLFETLGIDHKCTFIESTAENLSFSDDSFDTISSISVIEHIPNDGDIQTITHLWKLLKYGGRLLISVPCSSEDMVEYIDYNEYGLLTPDDNNFIFGQRFYTQNALQNRIFTVTGCPIKVSVYGEKKHGMFLDNRNRKLSDPNYPYWREPYMMGRDYQYYSSINDLPGWGVVAMEFLKT